MTADSSSDPSRRLADLPLTGEEERRARRKAENDAWAISGLLLSGVVVWGGAGWLLSSWLHQQLFVLAGILLGTGTALYGIWVRYGEP